MKIWTCGSSPRSVFRNAWTRIKNVNGASRLCNFWNFFGAIQMISCRDWWPFYHFDPETKQQSVEWLHSGSPRPKNFGLQKSAGKFLASIFWDQDGILLIDYLLKAKLPTWSITHLCWCNWRTFWRKNVAKSHQGGLVLARQCPGSRALATQKKLACLGFQRLDHPPYSPDLAPSTTTCSLDRKNNWKVSIFRPTRSSLQPRRPGWTDNVLNFFLSGLQKLEHRGEYVE